MEKLSIAEISRKTNIPESTLRYRTKLFRKFLIIFGKGRKKKFAKESLDRFQYINNCFEEGLSTDSIVTNLEKKYGQEAIVEESKTGLRKIKNTGSKIDFEIMAPMIKIIENQEIIITELRTQNRMLKEPKQGFLKKLFF